MRVERMAETAILTAEEYAILVKAHEILDDISGDCETSEDLFQYACEAEKNLHDFLEDGEDRFYKVEEDLHNTITVEINIR